MSIVQVLLYLIHHGILTWVQAWPIFAQLRTIS